MDLQKILSDLRVESDRIGKAIESLMGIGSAKKTRSTKGIKTGRRRRGMSREGRRRLSLAMKKRWAERKRKDRVAARVFAYWRLKLLSTISDPTTHLLPFNHARITASET